MLQQGEEDIKHYPYIVLVPDHIQTEVAIPRYAVGYEQ